MWSGPVRPGPLSERIGKSISRSTMFRILDSAVTKPCQHRSWIFSRTAGFAEKAAVILELYQGMWDGEPPGPNNYVISGDEKMSIPAPIRCHDSLPVQIGRPLRVVRESVRGGVLQCLAPRRTACSVSSTTVRVTGVEPRASV